MDAGKIIGGATAGAGIGPAAVYVANRLGAHLTSEDGALIGVTAITVGAFIAHNGIKGVFRIIWRGQGSSSSSDKPAGVTPQV